MKKLLLVLLLVGFTFTLAGCEDTGVLEDITAIEETIAEINTDITALEDLMTDLEAVQLSVETLGMTFDEIESSINALKFRASAISEDMSDAEMRIAALEEMLAEMKSDMLIEGWQDMLNTEIVFMFNNDVHGRVNDDSWAGSMGYATIKNIVDEVRANYEHTYLIAAGDMFHGTTFATLEEGESVVEVMNAVGYDIMVPGNHDFDYGQDRLLELELLADFPLISANIQYDADDSDMFDPYFIQEFGDVTVGFFGVTTPDTTYMTHPLNVVGLNFLDPETQAAMYVEELEEMGADVIVMLAHVGLDESSSITTEDIAMNVDGIDIIIDGHSHTYLPQGQMVNDTLIVSTGEYNKNLGILTFTVEDGEIIKYNGILINADEAEMLNLGIDQDVQDIIDAIEVDQEEILSVVIGQTAVELDGVRDNVRTGETNLGKIITDSMIVATGADIAITNGGGIRASIAVGDITVGDVITVLPFGNIIVTMDLTGAEIIEALEHGTSSYPSSSGKYPHVSGLTYDLLWTSNGNSRVDNVMIGGVAIDLNATYSVATNDFLAAGGDGYEVFGNAETTGEFMGLHESFEDMFTIGVDIVIPADARVTEIESLPGLFISEYIEGGSNNKAIELYNYTDAEIDLTSYSIIENYGSGSNTYNLVGTLAAGEVLVLCTDAVEVASLLDTNCDIAFGYPSVTHFNGDDTVQLLIDGLVIDQIGVEAEAGGDNFAQNVTLVRNSDIVEGNIVFDLAGEWTSYAQDTFDYIGSHVTD